MEFICTFRGTDPDMYDLQLVSLAENISSPQHSRVAIVLALLADIMAHTQRVTLAEGLYR